MQIDRDMHIGMLWDDFFYVSSEYNEKAED